MSDTTDAATQTTENSSPERVPRRAPGWWLDVLIFLVLCVAAFPVRWHASRGDLWLDEADYAFAAARGFQANRHDTTDVPSEPERLLRYRHYHPPLVSYAVGVGLLRGPQDRNLRLPFVLAGCLSIGLVYLCGLALLGGTALSARLAALGCAVLVIFTPPVVRAGSHALPWAFIILWLLALLWTLARYADTRRSGWLVGACAALAGMFVTSEYFYPALLAIFCSAPFLFAARVRERGYGRRVAIALGAGVVLFLAIAWALWPAGLRGDSLKMLLHYAAMAHDPWPVIIKGRYYERAPKWAYAFWYWRDYKPLVALYSLGALAFALLAAKRLLAPSAGVLGALTAVVLLTAHRSHIIGPEYLAHALPLLTLLTGFVFAWACRRSLPLGVVVIVLPCLVVAARHNSGVLPGMDARAQLSRWPDAARFLGARWKPGYRMLAPQYGGVGRWYLMKVAGAPVKDWQVQALPPQGAASEKLISDLCIGVYRYVAVGNTFADVPSVDRRVFRIIGRWPVVWRSDEQGTGPSRLLIYSLPPGTNSRHPLPIPR